MKTYTEGPWRVGDGGATVFGPKTEDGSLPKRIATIAKGLAADQDKANARLIAAAPNLLVTLEWIAQEIEWGHDMTASLAIATQAIKNAT